MFHIVLLEPEIPANTGNIGRTCLVTGSALHLIEPMGFILNDKNLKRAGMDYWKDVDVRRYDCLRDFQAEHSDLFPKEGEAADTPAGKELAENGISKDALAERPPVLWYATTKAQKTYCDVSFRDGDYIMFGKESAGIPEEMLTEYPEQCIRIPMASAQRSLNLSNSAAIVLYEALRQNDFLDLEQTGHLHRLNWK